MKAILFLFKMRKIRDETTITCFIYKKLLCSSNFFNLALTQNQHSVLKYEVLESIVVLLD